MAHEGKVDKAGLQIDGLLTKDPDKPKGDYYERIRQHEPARRVKLLGDIASDTDPARLALLPGEMRTQLTKKYAAPPRHLSNTASHN